LGYSGAPPPATNKFLSSQKFPPILDRVWQNASFGAETQMPKCHWKKSQEQRKQGAIRSSVPSGLGTIGGTKKDKPDRGKDGRGGESHRKKDKAQNEKTPNTPTKLPLKLTEKTHKGSFNGPPKKEEEEPGGEAQRNPREKKFSKKQAEKKSGKKWGVPEEEGAKK